KPAGSRILEAPPAVAFRQSFLGKLEKPRLDRLHFLVAPPASGEGEAVERAADWSIDRLEYLVMQGNDVRTLPEAARIVLADMIALVRHVGAEIVKDVRQERRAAPMHPEHNEHRPSAAGIANPRHLRFNCRQRFVQIGAAFGG